MGCVSAHCFLGRWISPSTGQGLNRARKFSSRKEVDIPQSTKRGLANAEAELLLSNPN